MKVFVDTDSDIRLIRRLKRDISHRGRDISGIIKQYNKFVKPAFEQYIEPTVQSADIVVPRGERGLYWCCWDSSSQTRDQPAWLTGSCLFLCLTGGENFVALDLIVQHVHSQLEKVGILQRIYKTLVSECMVMLPWP